MNTAIYNDYITEELSIDVCQLNSFPPPLVKQKDANSRKYHITVTKNGSQLIVPNDAEIWFNCRNQTNSEKRSSLEGDVLSDGTILVTVPKVVMDVPGYIECDLSIITLAESENDTNILKTTTFLLYCQESANPNGSSGTAEDTILAKMASGELELFIPNTYTKSEIDDMIGDVESLLAEV